MAGENVLPAETQKKIDQRTQWTSAAFKVTLGEKEWALYPSKDQTHYWIRKCNGFENSNLRNDSGKFRRVRLSFWAQPGQVPPRASSCPL